MASNTYTVQKEAFLDLFGEVLTPDGMVRNCGREKCKELILAAKKLAPEFDYGNLETGFLNVETLFYLYNSVY